MAEAATIAMAPQGNNLGTTYGNITRKVIGEQHKTWGVVIIAMIVLLLIFLTLWLVYMGKWKTCESKNGFLGTNPLGNLNTGSNNPLWQYQMGDAGWGGSMHSTYQPGQPRVWGASAEGGHEMAVVPQTRYRCGTGASPAALDEAQALVHAQALEAQSSSAKNMSDDALMRVMNGGSAY